ncbi:hypothetical protein Tco_0203213, partial [Tanacetum coccineum]
SGSEEMSKKIKMEDLSHLMQDKRSAFFTPDSPPDEPIIVSDESEEEQTERHEEPADTSVPPPPSPKSFQLQELLDQLTELLIASLKPKLSKLLASHDFASSISSELKELPLKITTLAREIQELKRHVQGMEIELPGDLKYILTKLETFTSTVSSLMSQVAELKTLK